MNNIPQVPDPDKQDAVNQIYGALDGAIPTSDELMEWAEEEQAEEEWTEDQLKNLERFYKLLKRE